MTYMSTRNRSLSGKLALLLALTAALSYGCSPARPDYGYRVTMPVLQAAPTLRPCVINERPGTCACFAHEDAMILVRKLKAACLALGGTVEACQAEEPEPTR